MINDKYKDINNYIININEKILGTKDDIYFISNSVLTRNPFNTKILFNEKKIPSITKRFMFFSIIKYYLKAFLFFFVYIIKSVIYQIIRKKRKINAHILIDTFFIVDKILQNCKYKDSYFLNLEDQLKRGNYAYLVKSFYGSSLNIKKFYKLMLILNKSEKDIISEFDFINFIDIIKIFYFILLYPFKILNVLSKKNDIHKVFDYSLIESLNGSDFKSYIRYLVGQKINNKHKFQKVISWCEYQDIDKSFYKGINELDSNIIIYGCQFLVTYDSWLNFFIPKDEEKFGLTPSMILSNGNYYLNFLEVDKKIGVSLRYTHIFTSKVNNTKEDYILVLGSFIQEETVRLINIVRKSNLSEKVIIRLHPTHSFDMYDECINPRWILSNTESLDDAIAKSYMIITNGATGTSLETICKAKSTIIIGNNDKYNSIPLIDYGKGKIWDIAFSEDDVKLVYNNLLKYRRDNIKELKEISTWYKDNFFVEPTKNNIIKAFDLEKDK